MSSTIEILSPNREVQLKRGAGVITITVRELSWKEQRQMLARIESQLQQLLGAQKSADRADAAAGIVSLIKDSQELSELIVRQTCRAPSGAELPAEWVDELSLTEFFALLDVALELNVSTLAAGTKKTYGRITSFVGGSAAAPKTPTMASPN